MNRRHERALVISAMVGLVLLSLLAGLLKPNHRTEARHRPSTFFTDPSGARALLLVLEKVLPPVEQWRRPLRHLPAPDGDGAGTLIVAGPILPLSPTDARALDNWIAEGGQLILATDNGWPIHDDAREPEESDPTKSGGPTPTAAGSGATPTPAEAPSQAATPSSGRAGQDFAAPSSPSMDHAAPGAHEASGPLHEEATDFLGRHGLTLKAAAGSPALWRATGPSMPEGEESLWIRRGANFSGQYNVLARAGEHEIAVEVPHGGGRIVVIADPSAVNNEALNRADNAVWLVHLCAAWGRGRVLFDELHQGFGDRRTLPGLCLDFLVSPWGWCVLQIAAAGALFMLGYRRRLGRLLDPPDPPRRSPLELLEARAGLLEAAGSHAYAVELICQQLSLALRGASGRPIDLQALQGRYAEQPETRQRSERLERLLVLLESAQQEKHLSNQQLLEAGRLAGQLLEEVSGER